MENKRQFLNGTESNKTGLSPLPKQLPNGNYPASDFMRASIARDIIKGRRAAGLSQAELARRAGIQPAVLNRIEKAKVDPATATVDKVMAALKAVHKK
jgi:ribosome-binding protein aMBF1 (putative translation factor)